MIILEIELVCCNYVDAYGKEVHETVIIKNHDLAAALKTMEAVVEGRRAVSIVKKEVEG